MTASKNLKRSRLRAIRRTHRKRQGLPLRTARAPSGREPKDYDEADDLDVPDADLIGVTE